MTPPPAWLTTPVPQRLLGAFSRHGHTLRFVGGCVRDSVLGRPIGDLDAATPATPQHVLALLEAEDIPCIPTGLAHGTVTARIDGQPIEITTLREDTACDGRHADIRHTDDWERDAARRDFTMNALYLDAHGHLYDYFNGAADALAGRVRFIGQAQARIREDYLRILRFFRFYATHGAAPADTEALAACADEAAGLEGISGERIRTEMFKLLAAPNPAPSLMFMEQYGVLRRLGMAALNIPPVFAHSPADPLLRLLLLLEHGNAAALAERWRFSNAERARLLQALEAPVPPMIADADAKACLRRQGVTAFRDHVWRWYAAHSQEEAHARRLLALPDTWEIPVFPLSGKDLLAHGIPAGERMGRLLDELEARWEASGYTLSRDRLLGSL